MTDLFHPQSTPNPDAGRRRRATADLRPRRPTRAGARPLRAQHLGRRLRQAPDPEHRGPLLKPKGIESSRTPAPSRPASPSRSPSAACPAAASTSSAYRPPRLTTSRMPACWSRSMRARCRISNMSSRPSRHALFDPAYLQPAGSSHTARAREDAAEELRRNGGLCSKVGIHDNSYIWVAMAAALKQQGDPQDRGGQRDPREADQSRRQGLHLDGTFAPAIKSGEIDVGLVWHARVLFRTKGGVEMKSSFPAEAA